MKIDLHRALDSVVWSFIRLILQKVGLRIHIVEWIMACISLACFGVIINDFPTHFFKPGRGFRQGCSLSPLIFLLVMDVISLKIKKDQTCNIFQGIQITITINITHLCFVDDILTFGIILRAQWDALFYIFSIFGVASGLHSNGGKYTVLYFAGDMEDIEHIARTFGVTIAPLQNGIHYVGYNIKPCNCKNSDWRWLINKCKQKLSNWTQIFISGWQIHFSPGNTTTNLYLLGTLILDS